ncbi:hypothetical protein [Aurantimonas sp. VKM B-3413]|uniref:hypothetical protein n=1 Tax=Aurantimonas sp. VKM B-3413 TaxID=2779401 RepID=UPI001E36D3FD|nr:hypothetical protein [Aurantimonas sp. VKM B-3413]MCB8838253.1 hypothetical protein [Aurantimonas sp. VKM B-3413]
MSARRRLRSSFVPTLSASALAAFVLAGPLPAIAQDGATPRAVPKDFVLPGPPPKGAPETGASAPQSAGETAEGDQAKTQGRTAGAAEKPMAFAHGAEKGSTDWPCVQRRIDTITPATIWAGPDLALAGGVERSQEMRALVDQVVVRRLPVDEAEAKVKDFVASLPQEERDAKAAALFSDILARLNNERSQVMSGIERYGAKQRAMAARLREESKKINALQRSPTNSPTDLDEAHQQILWDTRVFDERRKSLSYVCEVPTLIEQRAFALGRAVQQAL